MKWFYLIVKEMKRKQQISVNPQPTQPFFSIAPGGIVWDRLRWVCCVFGYQFAHKAHPSQNNPAPISPRTQTHQRQVCFSRNYQYTLNTNRFEYGRSGCPHSRSGSHGRDKPLHIHTAPQPKMRGCSPNIRMIRYLYAYICKYYTYTWSIYEYGMHDKHIYYYIIYIITLHHTNKINWKPPICYQPSVSYNIARQWVVVVGWFWLWKTG